MFSSRIPWSLAPNALTTALAAHRDEGRSLLDLTASNPTRAALAYPRDAVLSSLADDAALRYEPSPAGMARAREAVARYYLDALGTTVDPARVVLTASTSEAYAFLFKLLCDPGERVVVPAPGYPLFDVLAALETVTVDRYPLAYDGRWHCDPRALERSVTPSTRAVLCVHPNNPTGAFVKRDELDAIAAVCARHDLALVSDEVFADYAFAPDASRVPTFATRTDVLTFALSGLSKIAGLPQMKLAWIVVGGPDALVRDALDRLEHIADTYLSVGAPVQCAAATLLATRATVRDQIADRTRRNLATLRDALAADPASACSLLDVEGGWYATLRVPATRSDQDWALELLTRDDVLVQPGYYFDFPREAYLVISLLTEEQVFGEGVRRVLARMRSGE